jgi:hypothetical protein
MARFVVCLSRGDRLIGGAIRDRRQKARRMKQIAFAERESDKTARRLATQIRLPVKPRFARENRRCRAAV